ncbi:protein translocase subunit SecF [Thermopetrobacter sp. TC1]|uniref:protein translocase subunit SecF n=1 Tax=Thermopetrobacter sp. TC1 TaxID=1495045 RepID=UPI000571FE12|nr:protein translocase subunit SecF [Thermopetrobacter sp. TC1]
MLKPIKLIPDNLNIGFMRWSKVAIIASTIAILVSIAGAFVLGLNFGIDFKGGTLIEIRTKGPADIAALRKTIGKLGLGSYELQEFGDPRDILIRFETQPGGEEAQQKAIRKVKEALGPEVEYRRVEIVGPKVSGELTKDGIIAVLTALVGVMIYIWFRFEWQFALGAVASLTHDVLLTIGLFAFTRLEFNLSIIAAILTIVGYSLNDTVVVYDRIRENMRRYKKKKLPELIDLSINQMLSRTILTSLSTLVALLALYFFGGEVIRGFTFTMIWGVLVGTYSSIFIAAPILIWLGARLPTEEEAAAAKEKAASRP